MRKNHFGVLGVSRARKLKKKTTNGARYSYPYLMIFGKYFFSRSCFNAPLMPDVAVGLGQSDVDR